MTPRLLFVFALIAALLLPGPASAADSRDLPAPVAALKQQGLKMNGTFKAANGLTGYAASYHGRPIAIYVTPDGQHAIIGTLIDGQGNDLSAAPLQRLVANPKYQKAWAKFKNATWVADGPDDADRVIYMFTDANCPYCHQFWKQARPWVRSGKIQIRHVLIGLLKPSSLPKAASILAADHPSAALDRSERHYDQGGIQPMKNPPAGVIKKIGRNTDLMKSLGFYATPAIVYHTANGHVGVTQGVPQGQALIRIMGSPKPKTRTDDQK